MKLTIYYHYSWTCDTLTSEHDTRLYLKENLASMTSVKRFIIYTYLSNISMKSISHDAITVAGAFKFLSNPHARTGGL